MRAFVQEWSPLIAALLVVISIVYTGTTIRTHTAGVQARLATLEMHMESLRNAIEGKQGMIVRIATLDSGVNEKLQNLIVQRDSYIEQNKQKLFDVQNELQALKNNVDTMLNMTQRIEYIEEILLDMQASIEDIKKQQNRANR